jgi:peptidoglycan/LPS O-acetylase OafA/YrhL
MGTYRLLLALAVALSHAGVTFLGGHNPGVVAVISFYLISGYVMTGLVRNYYEDYRKVPLFYLDRMARIFPQYLLFMALAAAGYLFLGFSSYYLSGVTLACAAANLAAIPLNFFLFSPAIARCMLIPQGWSLGLELMFYLLFPVVLISGRRNLWLALSLLVWLAAAFGAIDTDLWGYRLLPGTLFVFLVGSSIFDHQTPSLKHPAVLILALMAGCTPLLCGLGKMALLYNFEELLGLFIGVPALFLLARCKRTKEDDWLGNLSYGVFLCHFLVIWTLESLGMPPSAGGNTLVPAASLLLGYFGYVAVERPVLRWRRGLRQAAVHP